VSEWHKKFKEGQESLEDERKGRPSTSRTEESTELNQVFGPGSNFECSDVRRNDTDE
jgi:hypothetical protein